MTFSTNGNVFNAGVLFGTLSTPESGGCIFRYAGGINSYCYPTRAAAKAALRNGAL